MKTLEFGDMDNVTYSKLRTATPKYSYMQLDYLWPAFRDAVLETAAQLLQEQNDRRLIEGHEVAYLLRDMKGC